MLSIWERNSFIQYDHIIVGGGIVGLCTAFYLKEKFPDQTVMILERGLLPSGASTKNAGFACMGSLTEILDDLHHSTEEEVLELFLLRKRGLERLQQLLGTANMGYRSNGSYELLFENDLPALERIDAINLLLQKELKQNAFTRKDEKITEFGFAKQQVKAMIENTCEGEIDTGLMMKNLIKKVSQAGIDIKTGCEVLAFAEQRNSIEIICKNPVGGEIIFKAEKLFICNNAFAKTLLPDVDVSPGRGQVLITKPIEGLKFKGIFHFDKGYYYFREYKGCILFGGGRNLDFEKETSTAFSLNQKIQTDLIEKLSSVILPGQAPEIDLQWSGIMAFGETKRPIVKNISEKIFVAVRMGGMGVAIGSEVGFQLSEMA